MRHTFFFAALASACFACGAIAPADAAPSGAGTSSGAGATSGAGTVAALTIPLGVYTGCSASTVNVAGNLTATNGGDGTLTLSPDGKGGVAGALSFEQRKVGNPNVHVVVGSGTIGFVPTSSTTAAMNAGAFELQTVNAQNASTTVPVAASALSLVGDTLFLSVHGSNADTKLSGFFSCPVPTSAPPATAAVARTAGSIPAGTYGGCVTASAELPDGFTESGGDLSLSLTRANDGTLTVTPSGGFPSVCGGGGLAFHDLGGAGMLSSGQTCAVASPCGPPPSLGPSTAPDVASLTNMSGSIQLVAGTLFINVAGTAPSEACGDHAISLICPYAAK